MANYHNFFYKSSAVQQGLQKRTNEDRVDGLRYDSGKSLDYTHCQHSYGNRDVDSQQYSSGCEKSSDYSHGQNKYNTQGGFRTDTSNSSEYSHSEGNGQRRFNSDNKNKRREDSHG